NRATAGHFIDRDAGIAIPDCLGVCLLNASWRTWSGIPSPRISFRCSAGSTPIPLDAAFDDPLLAADPPCQRPRRPHHPPPPPPPPAVRPRPTPPATPTASPPGPATRTGGSPAPASPGRRSAR